MPLTWDITRCAESPETLNGGDEAAVTETLIFASMGIGIGDWTEANAAEVYGRIHLMEAVYGAFLRTTGPDGTRVDRPITPEDVRRRIGLRTNVGRPETRASFLKRHCVSVVTDAMYQYQRAEQKRLAAPVAETVYRTPEAAAAAS